MSTCPACGENALNALGACEGCGKNTSPCRICSRPTDMTDVKLCSYHWSMSLAINFATDYELHELGLRRLR